MIERYTRPEMGKIWTPENRYQAWLRVELAVCEAWNRVGEISDADMETLRKEADFTVGSRFTVDRANEIEETTRHDVIAFLTALEEKVGPAARFIHLGCTSSDIVDTAGALLMVEAGRPHPDRRSTACSRRSRRCQPRSIRACSCMGRTHRHPRRTHQHSPLKMAGFYAEFQARPVPVSRPPWRACRVGKLSGAVGTYAVLSPEVEAIVPAPCSASRPDASVHAGHPARPPRRTTSRRWPWPPAAVERLCAELRHLQRTEVREVEEGFGQGQKGSSAMPHKTQPHLGRERDRPRPA